MAVMNSPWKSPWISRPKFCRSILSPSMILLSVLLLAYILFRICDGRLRLVLKKQPQYFSGLKFPKEASVAAGICIAGSIVSYGKSEVCFTTFVNTSVVIAAIGFFCGAAFLDFYLKKAIKSNPLRFLIHLGIYFISMLIAPIAPVFNIFILYFLVAVVDSFANFRRICNEREMDTVEER